jgi:hypothetical protein
MSTLLSLLLLLLCTLFGLAASAAVPESHTATLGWCSGTAQFASSSRIEIVSTSDLALTFSVCSNQSRGLSAIKSARLEIGDINVGFALCLSRLDCAARSVKRRVDGLYCFDGHTTFMFHLPSSPFGNVTINVPILGADGSEQFRLCGTY